jgi:hypothetical protein
MAGRNISNPITYATLSSASPQSLSDFDNSFSPLYGVVTDSGNWANYGVDTGSANAYTITLSPAAASYENGMILAFQPVNSNTGASTINVNGLGSKSIVNAASLALNGGEISANAICTVMYDGTNFRIIGPCPLQKNLGVVSTNQTINCAGYTSVKIYLNITTNANGLIVTLSNLGTGIPVVIRYDNSYSGALAIVIQSTNPATTSYAVTGVVSGQSAINLAVAGLSINAGQTALLTGMSDSVPNLDFAIVVT